jgi:hypothetical protein
VSVPQRWGGRHVAQCIADAAPRRRVQVTGVVVTAAMARWRSMDAWVCRLDDGTGVITVVFGGSRPVPGVVPGACLHVEATTLADNRTFVLWNPLYHFARPVPRLAKPARRGEALGRGEQPPCRL